MTCVSVTWKRFRKARLTLATVISPSRITIGSRTVSTMVWARRQARSLSREASRSVVMSSIANRR